MRDKARLKALEDFTKDVEQGLPFSADYLQDELDSDIYNNSLLARNLSEEALAQQVLKNTGIPIPNENAPKVKMQDFYQRILAERYPEFKPDVMLGDLKAEGVAGWYNPVFNTIAVDENLPQRRGLSGAVGTLLHEAGHQYDHEMGVKGSDGIKHLSKPLDLVDLRKARDSGVDLKKMDPTQVYELLAKEHHAQIPKLREGTFGLGALKSYLKSGTFKGVAPVLAKGAVMGAGGLASLASEAADTESTGEAPEQAAMLRDIDQRNREKKILEAMPEQNRQQVQKDLEDQRLGIKRNVLEGMLRK